MRATIQSHSTCFPYGRYRTQGFRRSIEERPHLTSPYQTARQVLSDLYRWAHAKRRHTARVVLACGLSVALFSLKSPVDDLQLIDLSPARRIAAAARGDYSPAAFERLAGTMPASTRVWAARHEAGVAAWQPPRPEGWPVYNIQTPPGLLRRDLSFDEAREFNGLVPVSALPNPPMKPFILPGTGPERERALMCLAQAVYYEAGFESGEGQQAVAQVVLNRLRHPGYPKSVCGVVYQGSQRATGCQFSFTCDGSLARAPSAAAWARSRDVARMALAGYVHKPVGASTHYHANYVFPYWAVTLVKLRQIGAHIFYRMTGPTGAPEAFSGRYAGGETVLSAAVLTGGDARTPDAPTVIAPPEPTPVAPPPRVVTLTVGGETRSYTVAPAGAPPTPADPAGPGAAPMGVLRPVRRQPTPEEIQKINESLKRFEDAQIAAKAKAAAPPEPKP